MLLAELRVVHLAKKRGGVSQELPSFPLSWRDGLDRNSYFLDSCQRWLWIARETALPTELPEALEVLTGVDGYLFLLRVAAGLESEIKGETDIFGQLKEACRGKFIEGLDTWMQRLFEDTKEIRAQYLQGLGGSSYGSLVRKLLPDSGSVILIGAGQLARSIGPYLRDRELWLVNRSQVRLMDFYAELASKPGAPIHFVKPDNHAHAWSEAKAVIICAPFSVGPFGGEMDQLEAFRGKTVIHLGGYRDRAGRWKELEGLRTLDCLFELQRTQSELRDSQLAQAGKACETRAKLRALGASLSIAHGWEDLAVFG